MAGSRMRVERSIGQRAMRVVAGAGVTLAVLVAGVGVPDGLVRQAAAVADTPSPQQERSVDGRAVEASKPAVAGAEDAQPSVERANPGWPKGGSGRVDLPAGVGAVAVAGLPVSVAAVDARVSSRSTSAPSGSPSSVRVEVFGNEVAERLGGVGLAVRLTRADGGTGAAPAKISLDYSAFRHAFPGGFASRLTLVELPGCVLAARPDEACRSRVESARVLPVVNETGAGRLSAEVTVGSASPAPETGQAPPSGPSVPASLSAAKSGAAASTSSVSGSSVSDAASGRATSKTSEMSEAAAAAGGESSVYAVAASAESTSSTGSPDGSFRATDLKPSGTWTVGPAGGSVSYTYPITVPPAPSGAGPKLALEYSSAAVDSLSDATNNQGSWAGMGWELGAGFIEQTIPGCAAGGPYGKHLCWQSPEENDQDSATTDYTTSQLTLSVGGRSSQIVKDKTSGAWRTVEDFGWKIERVASGAPSGSRFGR